MIGTNSPEFAEMYPVAAAKLRRAKMDAALPGFRSWTRTADGGATLNGYAVIRISERAYVAYAPNGDAVNNTGDWTTHSRPFVSLIAAIGACREHAIS